MPTEVPKAVRALAHYLGVPNGARAEPPCRRTVQFGNADHVVEMGWWLDVERGTPPACRFYSLGIPDQCLTSEAVLAVFGAGMRARIDGGRPRYLD